MGFPWSRGLMALAALVVLLALSWLLFWGESAPAYTIQTTEVSRGVVERTISATGSVQALVTVDVSSQLSGQISEVRVDFNSPVNKGDTLAVIDPRTFSSKVASAEANLAIAKSNVAVQKAGVAKAVAMRGQAERALERQKKLIATRATAEATLDEAQTQFDTAAADVSVAAAQLENAEAGVTQKEAELAQSKLDLDRTAIRTPIDGVVIARNVDPGSTVAASLQAPVLFQIAQDLEQIEILVLVDEADIGAIEAGQDVTFTVDAFPGREFKGEVAQVRIAGETTSNVVTYTVVVRAQNPRQKLLPGMTATVRIITGRREDVLRVPNEAVRFVPPKDIPTTQRAERPNRDDAIVGSLSQKLAMTPEQVDRFKNGLAATRRERSAAGSKRSTGGERERNAADASGATGKSIRTGRISSVLDGILTDAQKALFATLREAWRDNTRPANLWQETPGGLKPHRVILGLVDEAYSEVLRADLKEGDTVVVRARPNGEAGGASSRRGERQSR
jgi:HlyD family secretion protein